MRTEDIMTTNVVTVRPTAKVEEVADILHTYHFTGVPVVDEYDRVLGVIMERDFITADSKLYLPTYISMLRDMDFVQNDAKRLSADAQRVIHAIAADVLNPNIVVAHPHTSLQQLAELFATKRVNPIPVVDDGYKLIGVVSRSDLIKLFSPTHVKATRQRPPRVVDATAAKAQQEVRSNFAFVNKTRVAIWFIIAVGVFIMGFILGVAWVVAY